MKKVIADLHYHSKYSRAVSQKMDLVNFVRWGKKKGVGLLTTTDFTHPLWLRNLENQLVEVRDGIYQLQNTTDDPKAPFFVFTTEISLIFGSHRIHLIVFAPNLAAVKRLVNQLTARGINLLADGRPTLGMRVQEFVDLILNTDSGFFVVPAHIWTPWFSLFGSRSGFDSLAECFGRFANQITAVETGLSSDPLMNWQIEELDSRVIVSFSDAHNPTNIGREATVFELPEQFTYQDIITALQNPFGKNGEPRVVFTIEFYPQEGKYHFSGHRNCNIRYSPKETKARGGVCPVCGRPLTIGVMDRVVALAGNRQINPVVQIQKGMRIFYHPQNLHHPFATFVPLLEIIAEAIGSTPRSEKTLGFYQQLVNHFGNEIQTLLKAPLEEIERCTNTKIAEGIQKVRRGEIIIEPGFDGVYGKIKIWGRAEKPQPTKQQMSLF